MSEVDTQEFDGCGIIYQLNGRLLGTGKGRVRDGQTLILTGVISDEDRSVVTKWPILGDLPLVGQFFRRSSGDRRKSEHVIMVTTRVIKDDHGGMYGNGYQLATNSARGFLHSDCRSLLNGCWFNQPPGTSLHDQELAPGTLP